MEFQDVELNYDFNDMEIKFTKYAQEKENYDMETLEEPNFHKRNVTLCMKLFPYLAARTKLTFEEIAYFYGIKNIVTKPYDAENP